MMDVVRVQIDGAWVEAIAGLAQGIYTECANRHTKINPDSGDCEGKDRSPPCVTVAGNKKAIGLR